MIFRGLSLRLHRAPCARTFLRYQTAGNPINWNHSSQILCVRTGRGCQVDHEQTVDETATNYQGGGPKAASSDHASRSVVAQCKLTVSPVFYTEAPALLASPKRQTDTRHTSPVLRITSMTEAHEQYRVHSAACLRMVSPSWSLLSEEPGGEGGLSAHVGGMRCPPRSTSERW